MDSKKAMLITLYGNSNYGNKLQNYAVQRILENRGYEIYTIVLKKNFIKKSKTFVKVLIEYIKMLSIKKNINEIKRYKKFVEFDKKIKKKEIKSGDDLTEFSIAIIGSDQIWNPTDYYGNRYVDILLGLSDKKMIAFSASIAISSIPMERYEKYKKHFNQVNYISLRETAGKKIVEECTKRKDIEVLLDPTMLINSGEWDKIIKKPSLIDKVENKKYLLNCFLGKMSDERQKAIDSIAKENNLYIINILDNNDSFYNCSPDEFLWLEKNASLICTDSFHSVVFAIINKTPFLVFNRDSGQIGKNHMNSRLEELLNKFNFNNRFVVDNKIECKIFKCDFSTSEVIIKKEQEKANNFLDNALKNI